MKDNVPYNLGLLKQFHSMSKSNSIFTIVQAEYRQKAPKRARTTYNNIFATFVFGGHPGLGLFQLGGDAAAVRAEVAAAPAGAEDAAPGVQGAVPVGTAHMGIQGYFIAFVMKVVFTVSIQRIIGLTMPIHSLVHSLTLVVNMGFYCLGYSLHYLRIKGLRHNIILIEFFFRNQ